MGTSPSLPPSWALRVVDWHAEHWPARQVPLLEMQPPGDVAGSHEDPLRHTETSLPLCKWQEGLFTWRTAQEDRPRLGDLCKSEVNGMQILCKYTHSSDCFFRGRGALGRPLSKVTGNRMSRQPPPTISSAPVRSLVSTCTCVMLAGPRISTYCILRGGTGESLWEGGAGGLSPVYRKEWWPVLFHDCLRTSFGEGKGLALSRVVSKFSCAEQGGEGAGAR